MINTGTKYKTVQDMLDDTDKDIKWYEKVLWWFKDLLNYPVKLYRTVKWAYQRKTRGWDDRELWDLDLCFARWVSKKLRSTFIPLNKKEEALLLANAFDEYGDLSVDTHIDETMLVKRLVDLLLSKDIHILSRTLVLEVSNWWVSRLDHFDFSSAPSCLPIRKHEVRCLLRGETNCPEADYDLCVKQWKKVIEKIVLGFDKLPTYYAKYEHIHIEVRKCLYGYFVKYYTSLWN